MHIITVLILLALAESLTVFVGPVVGAATYLLVVVLCILYRTFSDDERMGRLALGLELVPLIRVLSLGLPLGRLPERIWYPLLMIPLLIAAWHIIHQVGLSSHELGVQWGNLPLQIAIAVGGIPLGMAEHLIIHPAPVNIQGGPAHILSMVALIVAVALFEEFVFRGILQSLAWRALRLHGLILISSLYAVMHLGYRSAIYLMFVCAVGYLFSYLVHRGGSLLGVALAHSIASVLALLVIPTLGYAPFVPWATTVCTPLALAAVAWVAVQPAPSERL
ncbi:MAG: CPBP family intramembrane metalloprotease [Oscillochloris sp.]|nr:CPBP family intramembrane metalloprotease [Oscillochloris sp.]